MREKLVVKDNKTTHRLINSDFFDVQGLSCDMVMTDLPYGTTNAKWDSLVDLDGMWQWLGNIRTPNTPCTLVCTNAF